MTQDEHLKKLKAAILEGNPSKIVETLEAHRPGHNVREIYILPDGSIVDFSVMVLSS